MTEEVRSLLTRLRKEGCRLCIHQKLGICTRQKEGRWCDTLTHNAAYLIERLAADLDRVTKERDAAVEDVARGCITCKNSHLNDRTIDMCKYARNECVTGYECLQWRGVQEEV